MGWTQRSGQVRSHTHWTDLLISWVLIASSCPFSLVSQAQCIPDVSRWLAGWAISQLARSTRWETERGKSEGKERKSWGYLSNLDNSAGMYALWSICFVVVIVICENMSLTVAAYSASRTEMHPRDTRPPASTVPSHRHSLLNQDLSLLCVA